MPAAGFGPCLSAVDGDSEMPGLLEGVAIAFHINQNDIVLAHCPIHAQDNFTHIRQSRRAIGGGGFTARLEFLTRLQTSLAGPHPASPSTACMAPRIHPLPCVCDMCEPGGAAGTTAVVGDFAHWCLGIEQLVPACVTARVTPSTRATCRREAFSLV